MQAFELTEGLIDYYNEAYPDYQNVSVVNVNRMTENWETIVFSYQLNYERDGEEYSKKMIIRLYPGRDGIGKATKEFNLMASLMMTSIPIPDPFRVETSSIFDLPFLIMEYIQGELLAERIMKNQDRYDFYLDRFARMLVEIHTVDYETMVHKAENYRIAPDPYQFLAQLLTTYKDKIEIHNKKEFIPILRWLVERMDTVPFDKLSLIHGDYHLANIMVDDDDEMYVIDWIDATIGDFRVDLAWTLILHETHLGKSVRDRILNTYREHSPFEFEGIKYFEVLAILRQLLDLSINFSYDNEIAKLNPSTVDNMMENLEPIKRSLGILAGHTKIKLKEFERML